MGISFEKYNYFDFNMLGEIAGRKFSKSLKGTKDEIPSLYLDESVRKSANPGGNQGVRSGVDLVGLIVHIFRKHDIKQR